MRQAPPAGPKRPAPPARSRSEPPEEIALRCHVEPPDWHAKPERRRRVAWPAVAMILRTVPVPAPGEPLWFGVACFLSSADPEAEPTSWVLFHRDSLPVADVECLRACARARGWPDPVPLREFLRLLYAQAYKKQVPVVGDGLPADLSRLAADWSSVTRGFYEGGVRLIVWTHPPRRSRTWKAKRPVLRNGEIEDGHRPPVYLKAIDGQRAFIGFGKRAHPDATDRRPEGAGGRAVKGYGPPGHFVDVATLAFALSGTRRPSLATACEAFEVKWSAADPGSAGELTSERIEAAVADARGIAALYLAELRLHREIGLPVAPDKAYSPAAYAEAYYQAMGISSPLGRWPEFPRDVLGRAMGAFHGGECFVGIRAPSTPLPVRVLDFGGLFPVVAGLEGAFKLLAAERVEVVADQVEDVREFVAGLAVRIRGWLADPSASTSPIGPEDWRRLARTYVDVICDADVLPHKVRAGESWVMQVSSLTSRDPVPFSLLDALRSTLDTGSVPRFVSPIRLVPVDRLPLSPVRLPSGRTVDPETTDFFVELAAERIRLTANAEISEARRDLLRGFYKTVDNAACFGLLVEMLSGPRRARRQAVRVFGPDGRERRVGVHVREEPARFYFPPIASAVTAGARLMLSLGRIAVETRGGAVAYADTDSLSVVSTTEGGLVPCPGSPERSEEGAEAVRALAWAEVESVRHKIEALSPYPGDLRPYTIAWDAKATEYAQGFANSRTLRVPAPLLLKLEPDNLWEMPEGVDASRIAGGWEMAGDLSQFPWGGDLLLQTWVRRLAVGPEGLPSRKVWEDWVRDPLERLIMVVGPERQREEYLPRVRRVLERIKEAQAAHLAAGGSPEDTIRVDLPELGPTLEFEELPRERWLHPAEGVYAGPRRQLAQAHLHAIATKRYATYQVMPLVEPEERLLRVVKASEHALTYLDPTGRGDGRFIAEGFGYLVRDRLGMGAEPPSWFDETALFRIACTHPEDLAAFDPGRKARRSVLRPWSRIAVAVPLKGRDADAPSVPVTPWFAGFDPGTAEWRAFRTGERLRLRSAGRRIEESDLGAGLTLVRTMGDVFERHGRGFDPKVLGPDGEPATSRTVGMLRAAPTIASGIVLIGKETRGIERVGVLHGPEYVVYQQDDGWADAVQVLRDFAPVPGEVGRMAAEAKVGVRTIERAAVGVKPRPETRHKLVPVLAARAREALRRQDPWREVPEDDRAAIAVYLRECGRTPPRCQQCGGALTGRRRDQRHCGAGCRRKTQRQSAAARQGLGERIERRRSL